MSVASVPSTNFISTESVGLRLNGSDSITLGKEDSVSSVHRLFLQLGAWLIYS